LGGQPFAVPFPAWHRTHPPHERPITVQKFAMDQSVSRHSRLTPVCMNIIDPFQKLIVYPSLLRSVRMRWNQAFGAA
jgi:hypothetical protein